MSNIQNTINEYDDMMFAEESFESTKLHERYNEGLATLEMKASKVRAKESRNKGMKMYNGT